MDAMLHYAPIQKSPPNSLNSEIHATEYSEITLISSSWNVYCSKSLVSLRIRLSSNPSCWKTPLFLVLPTYDRHLTRLQFLFQEFIHCESNSLSWRNTHYPRCYTFVECMEAFLSVRDLLAFCPFFHVIRSPILVPTPNQNHNIRTKLT